MLYKTPKGTLKDNHVIWHEGKYYMLAMYNDNEWRNMWIATSTDGVHWNGVGSAISNAPFKIWKMFVYKCGDRFMLNHGSFSGKPGHGNDTLCFWESKDLINWTYLGKEFDSHPDPKWYNETGRWDHMYVIPKEEGSPRSGYWGYCVGTPRPDFPYRSCGMLQSEDGVHWEAIPPPVIEWGNIPQMSFETGGCERIGDKYYLIGGTAGCMGNQGYANYTFVGDSPTGPFRPDVEAFRLCGAWGKPGFGLYALVHACFCRARDEILICNYMFNPWDKVYWMPPLKEAVVDQAGHLRMGYWKNNDAVKGTPIPVDLNQCKLVYPTGANEEDSSEQQKAKGGQGAIVSVSGNRLVVKSDQIPAGTLEDWHCIALLDNRFDLDKGLVLEGTITAHPAARPRPKLAGFYIEEKPEEGAAILMEIGRPMQRRTQIGVLNYSGIVRFDSEDVTGPGCATVTGLDSGRTTSFRLWIRKRMFELYADDLLVQGFITRETTGRVGFILQNGEGVFENLKAWEMSLEDVATNQP